MSSIVAIVAFLSLMTLLLAYFFIEHQRKEKLKKEKSRLTNQVSDIKANYKLVVENIAELAGVDSNSRTRLYAVANNFFVYQAIDGASVKAFAFAIDRINESFSALSSFIHDHPQSDVLSERLSLFVDALPKGNSGYNTSFYMHQLPMLNELLTVPPSAAAEAKEAEQENPQSKEPMAEVTINYQADVAEPAKSDSKVNVEMNVA
ncbi:hypothetical protein [Psychrobium sp. 1_MG-2023]|uniref:hypothetical protein n=1 Tax=Psychrobium sp. 1_MG-2023 TaxID=3062624 RepID=UPI000C33E833|nr:hypothetical protein [Psychrobium sp. 1_MG-2023]MDP2561796.1 hypothetical protein [Psychrobium sp. 1_MG-2023]PKF55830.1 hypothetical protein CW748_11870 [Alteromonadales bacterium alter-6D02]